MSSSASSSSPSATALVFGANGISGTAMLDALTENSVFKRIIAISRRQPQIKWKNERITFLSCDILTTKTDEIIEKLKQAGGENVTHVYHYTYIAKNDEKELVEINKQLFQKALDVTAAVATGLKVFHLQTGYKYYGVHKGGKYLAPIPFKEDASRHEGLNFYYIQEDMLIEASQKHRWKWLVTRPNVILGVTNGNFMNLAVSIAMYAIIQKELGQPLIFPGNEIMYNNIADHSSAINNARFQIWASTNENKTGNKAFNIHDGNKIKFADVWPQIARYFHISLPSADKFFTIPKPKPELGEIVCQLPLKTYMEDKEEVWKRVAAKHKLNPEGWQYATWEFVDFATGRTWPDDGDMTRARDAGWTTTVDTFEMYKDTFDKMKELNLIPK